ncbi:putative two-component hybrid sensor and regulator [Sphingomonas changbaiensis NBRC 104936]|uniref:histidine kinase n=1 Tax=Sphingomonas changbaiensis NBRC 104936 TaxID=1219043 RepID=A0A0E9MR17_9SPHN|nr:ATP-binding protein [Sphingomonas changbaiensis]GAO39580.1 putative two-component hybrid sensor and regulator [Sphingomonas changbaiensis NBRC 104936]
MGEISGHEVGQGSISVRRALAIALALMVAVGLIALTVFVTNSSRQRDEALAAQRHSFEVIILVRTLQSTMAEAELSLGRYVVNLQPEFGRVYVDDWRRAGLAINRLREVTRENPQQAALAAKLRAYYDQRGRLLSSAALRTRYDQKISGLAIFDRAGKVANRKELNDTLDRIIDIENRVLDARINHANATLDQSNWAATLLLAFALLLVIGAGVLGYSVVQAVAGRRAARRDADEVARRAENLEEAVAARTAELRRANTALLAEAAERESAEAQLRQAQKMDAVGQLTGGIAHDFNNMLAVVIGGLELAKRRLTDGSDDAGRHIENAMEGASRAAALTRRLLAFARAEPLLPEAVSPDALIAGMTDLLDRTLGERIKVRTRFASADWAVWVDKHQLENALLNLAVNARDAMDGDGTLTIGTGTRIVGEGELGDMRAGDYVAISVADTGCGMDRTVLDRVFEPFFTTKPVGKGTGLGLSQIFGFVRQSLGEIVIASQPGIGTTVTLLLPRFSGVKRIAPTELPPSRLPVRQRMEEQATILVVEDDPRVLNATVEALAELGHHPIPCATPDRAEALIDAHPDVRLVLSDVVMPGTTGPELIASLQPRHPHLGILFVTGYAGEIDEAAAFGGHGVLRKPFTIGALSGAVQAALARTSGPHPFEAAAAAE